jgi:hypothetical protein
MSRLVFWVEMKARSLTVGIQVDTFRDEFGLKAIAVNSSNGGCKVEVLQVISLAQMRS